MDTSKRFVMRHFELIVILVVIGVMVLIDQFIVQKVTFINFYYIPVLLAGYRLGKQAGALTALFCILAVVFCIVFSPVGPDNAIKRYSLGADLLTENAEEPSPAEPSLKTDNPLLIQKQTASRDPKDKAWSVEAHREILERDARQRELGVWQKGLRWSVITHIAAWGAFLFLSGVLVGTLSEERAKRLTDLRTAYVGTLEILSKYLEAADKTLRGHLIRVSDWATEIAGKLEMSPREVDCVQVAALLHDMPNLGVSIEQIQHAAVLTTREKESMDVDAEQGTGGELLMRMGRLLDDAAPVVAATRSLHERKGQEGKDDRGSKNEAPIGAQIVDIVHSFDTLTRDGAKKPQESIDEIAKLAAGYDEKVLAAAKEILTSSPPAA